MKIQLETTIGFVLVESTGHYIEVYTSEDSYREGLINLWDYEKGKARVEPNLSNVLHEVSDVLNDYFDDFGIWNIEVLEAEIEELLERDAIERLKMMENRDDYDA
jgi:hypothetical protein